MADDGAKAFDGAGWLLGHPSHRRGPLFLMPSHADVVHTVVADVLKGRAVVPIKGEPGVGKTALLLAVAGTLRSQGRLVVTLQGPSADPLTLFRAIGHAVGIPGVEAMTRDSLIEAVQTCEGARQVVLFIDDAQDASPTMFRCLALLLELLDLRPTKLQLVLCGTASPWPGLQPQDLDLMRQATAASHTVYFQPPHAGSANSTFTGEPFQVALTRMPGPAGTGSRSNWRRVVAITGFSIMFAGGAALTFFVNQLPTAIEPPRLSAEIDAAPPNISERPSAGQPPSAAHSLEGSTSVPPPSTPQPDTQLTQQANPAELDAEPQLATMRGGPGLVLIAGADDDLPALYAKVYRGMKPPPYRQVLSVNRLPVKPGALVVFPEPPSGWLH